MLDPTAPLLNPPDKPALRDKVLNKVANFLIRRTTPWYQQSLNFTYAIGIAVRTDPVLMKKVAEYLEVKDKDSASL